jgi:hypothetical protein
MVFASHRKSYYFQGHIAIRITENLEAATGILFKSKHTRRTLAVETVFDSVVLRMDISLCTKFVDLLV